MESNQGNPNVDAITREERARYLRNIVETTKGREMIRTRFQEIHQGEKAQPGSDNTADAFKELNRMIDVILEEEYPT